ncbi:MAG: ATP-binding cassette domain-containing protein, partial [Alphaproteobacteria bacterium]
MLEVRGLTRAFGGLKAVDGVDLDVPEGAIVALIGPNGAGKTTCFAAIAGFVRPDAGSVRFAGEDVTGRAPHVVARAGMVRTFQITQP